MRENGKHLINNVFSRSFQVSHCFVITQTKSLRKIVFRTIPCHHRKNREREKAKKLIAINHGVDELFIASARRKQKQRLINFQKRSFCT